VHPEVERECDECVFAHVGRDGEGAVGVQAHQQAAKDGGQHGGDGARSRRQVGIRKDCGVDYNDVCHRGEGGEASEHLGPHAAAMFAQVENSLQKLKHRAILAPAAQGSQKLEFRNKSPGTRAEANTRTERPGVWV
jgi:hypothetical protein